MIRGHPSPGIPLVILLAYFGFIGVGLYLDSRPKTKDNVNIIQKESLLEQNARQEFYRMDVDGNEVIDYEEYIKYMKKRR